MIFSTLSNFQIFEQIKFHISKTQFEFRRNEIFSTRHFALSSHAKQAETRIQTRI